MSSAPEPKSPPLLAAQDLTVEFRSGRRQPPFRALDGVSIEVRAGETVGVVGESGSGKTTLGRAILGLVPIAQGSVAFDGEDITEAGAGARKRLSAELQVVFQDPYSSFNPTRTIGQTLAETIRVHLDLSPAELEERVGSMLERVDLPRDAAERYPSNFSGGQRQRIAIARGLMVEPRLLICDEPVSALDLSVQAQVLNLLRELQDQLGVSYLFIAHDLDVVRHLAERIVVLYRGQVMEEGEADQVHRRPSHPYTRALLDAAPVPDPEAQRRRRGARTAKAAAEIAGWTGEGCVFASRCPYAIEVCRERRPPLEPTTDGSRAACHRWRNLDLSDAGTLSPSAGEACKVE